MDQQQPARSGLAAEIIARNAQEGAPTGWETLYDQVSTAFNAREARIDELEAREAKVAEFAKRFDWWRQWCDVCDTEGCATPENLWDLVPPIVEARKNLDWLPVVWIDPDEPAEQP